MVAERDAVTGNRINGWQRIIFPGEQPVTSLVTDHEDDVVCWLSSVSENRFTFFSLAWGIPLSLRDGTPESHHQTHNCQRSQAAAAEFPLLV